MKGREAALTLHSDYPCTWAEYSTLPGTRGRFRLLTFTVG